MEFLNNLVLPHSGTNLELLKLLLVIALIIFTIFSGVLFTSTFLSYIFKNKYDKSSDEKFRLMTRDYADLVTDNRSLGIFIGVVPLLAIIMIYLQLLHGTTTPVVGYLILSFIIFCLGLTQIYSYKNTLHLNHIFSKFKNAGKRIDEDTKRDIEDYSVNNSISGLNTPLWGLILLFFSLWIFTAASTLAIGFNEWNSSTSLISLLFSWDTISKFIHFLSASFAMTGTAYIVKYFYWDKRSYTGNEEYVTYSKKFNSSIALTCAVLQPVFFNMTMSLPEGLGMSYYTIGIIFIILLLVLIIVPILYQALKNNKFKSISYAFYSLLLVFALISVKEQNAFGIASKNQIETLASNYEKLEQSQNEEMASNEVSDVNGEEIYQTKCTACHAFDRRMVGPPHKEVLEKYKNDKKGMVEFILHPKKIRADYPEMPAQGLKPKEAKAVVEYMFKEYGEKLK